MILHWKFYPSLKNKERTRIRNRHILLTINIFGYSTVKFGPICGIIAIFSLIRSFD